MASLAVLGSSLSAQIRANPAAISGLELVRHAGDLGAFREVMRGQHLDVLLLDLDALGAEPLETLTRLQQEFTPNVTVVAYGFARREVVQQLLQQPDRVRALRKPLDLGQLRLAVLGHIVRGIFGQGTPAPKRAAAKPAVVPPLTLEVPVPAPRFTAEQLGRLQEMSSAIQCECPNHVSTLVQSLLAFEAYSRNCENRSPEDAAMHHLLFQKTAAARAIMEEALEALVKFENINLVA